MITTTTQNGNVRTTAVSVTAATIALKSFANLFAPRLYFRLDLVSEGSDLVLGTRSEEEFKEESNFPDATLMRLLISPISGSRSA
jgi:hypothetical protein